MFFEFVPIVMFCSVLAGRCFTLAGIPGPSCEAHIEEVVQLGLDLARGGGLPEDLYIHTMSCHAQSYRRS